MFFIGLMWKCGVLPCWGSWRWNQMSGHSLNQHSCNCQPARPSPGVCWSLHSSSLPHRQTSRSWCLAGCCSPAPQRSAWTVYRWDVVAGASLNSSENQRTFICKLKYKHRRMTKVSTLMTTSSVQCCFLLPQCQTLVLSLYRHWRYPSVCGDPGVPLFDAVWTMKGAWQTCCHDCNHTRTWRSYAQKQRLRHKSYKVKLN